MGRGKLTPEEIKILSKNPNVVSVNEDRIVYSDAFKKHFVEHYFMGEKPGAIFHNLLVLHKQAHPNVGPGVVGNLHQNQEHQGDAGGEEEGLFHALDVAAGVVVADERHDALGEAKGDLHGDGVDFLGDAHGRHGVGAKGGGEVDRKSVV